MGSGTAIAPKPDDHRFGNPAWQERPFDLLVQSVLLGEEWWERVINSPGGVDPQNRRIVAFTARQFLDLVSISNVPWLNPEVIAATRTSGGKNLADGLRHFLREQMDPASASATNGFTVGVDLAATPGKVVLRNALIELIQYTPTTPRVGPDN